MGDCSKLDLKEYKTSLFPMNIFHINESKINDRGNNKWRLCADSDETVNHIICSKLALKEYKTKLEWVGKITRQELSKTFKFDHINK